MIIHLDGSAQELLEFVKGMQFPIAHYAFGTAEEAENEEADQTEVDREVERMFSGANQRTGEPAKPWNVMIELDRIQWVMLLAEAEKEQMNICDLAKEIITDKIAGWMYAERRKAL